MAQMCSQGYCGKSLKIFFKKTRSSLCLQKQHRTTTMIKFDSLKIDASGSFDVSVSNDLTKIVFFKYSADNQIVIYDASTSTWLNIFVNKYQVLDAHWVREGVIFLKTTREDYILWNYNKEIEIAHLNAILYDFFFSEKEDYMIAQEPSCEHSRGKINVYNMKNFDLINSIEYPHYCWVEELMDDKLIFMGACHIYVYNLQGKVLYHEYNDEYGIESYTIYNQFFIKKTTKDDIIFTNMDDGKSFVHQDERYRCQTMITMPSESILVITDELESIRFLDLSNECKVLGRISDNSKMSIKVLTASSDDKKILYKEENCWQGNALYIIDIWSPVSRALQKYMLPILNSRHISLDTNKLLFNAIASSLSIGNRLYKNKIDQWLRCARKAIVENH